MMAMFGNFYEECKCRLLFYIAIVNTEIKCLGQTLLKTLIVTVRFIQTLHYFVTKGKEETCL